MLSDTGVDKGDIAPIVISIVYGSKALAQKLTSNTELTRSHNAKNLYQHTALNINLRQSHLLLTISGNIVLRKTAIPSVAIPHWKKAVVRSNANPLFASANPDLARIKRKIIQRGEVNDAIPHSHMNYALRHSHVNDAIRRLHAALT